jgi:hypothetical protein
VGRGSETHFPADGPDAIVEVRVTVVDLVAFLVEVDGERLVDIVTTMDAEREVVVAVVEADGRGAAPQPAGGIPERDAGPAADEEARIAVVEGNTPLDAGIEAVHVDRRRCAADGHLLADLTQTGISHFGAEMLLRKRQPTPRPRALSSNSTIIHRCPSDGAIHRQAGVGQRQARDAEPCDEERQSLESRHGYKSTMVSDPDRSLAGP